MSIGHTSVHFTLGNPLPFHISLCGRPHKYNHSYTIFMQVWLSFGNGRPFSRTLGFNNSTNVTSQWIGAHAFILFKNT